MVKFKLFMDWLLTLNKSSFRDAFSLGASYALVEAFFVGVLPRISLSQYPVPTLRLSILLIIIEVGAVMLGFLVCLPFERYAITFVRLILVWQFVFVVGGELLYFHDEYSAPAYSSGLLLQGVFLSLVVLFSRVPGGAIGNCCRSFSRPVPFSLLLLTPWFTVIDVLDGRSRAIRLISVGASVTLIMLIASIKASPRVRSALAYGVVGIGVAIGLWGFLRPAETLRANTQDGVGQNPVATSAASRPNILLVSLDTTRADHLSLYGYPPRTSPQLEILARQACIFENAVASSPMTLPSHASVFTGLSVEEHGAYLSAQNPRGRAITSSAPVFAEAARRLGYETTGIVANHAYLSSRWGFSRGFVYYDDSLNQHWVTPIGPYTLGRGIRDLIAVAIGEPEARTREATEIRRSAQVFLSNRDRRRPFLMFLNFMDAHSPYYPPPVYRKAFGADLGPFDGFRFQRLPYAYPKTTVVAYYDAGIRYMDEELGQLFRTLRENGDFDETLIIVLGDHGESFQEHGSTYHNGTVFEEEIHVPLLIKFPAQKEQSRVSQRVLTTDLYHVMVSAIRGDVLPPFRNGDQEWLISERHTRDGFIEAAAFNRNEKIIISRDGSFSVYDLKADPFEARNICHPGASSSVCIGARIIAAGWASRMRQCCPDVGAVVSAEERSRLRSLGYVN